MNRKHLDINLEPLVVQAADNSLVSLKQMIDKGWIDLLPKFQRRDRWDDKARSLLIESFLLNLPVPPVYLAQEASKYKVIDGKQRLTAIWKFMNDEFPLQNLEYLSDLNGKKFSALEENSRSDLEFHPLRTVTIQRSTNESLTRLVFRRLNTEGKPLSSQEIRNALFDNELNDLAHELSGNELLKESLKITNDKSSKYMKMEDIEFVFRYISVAYYYPHFPNAQAEGIDKILELSEEDDSEAKKIFSIARAFPTLIAMSEELWGDKRFQRWDPQKKQWRDQVIGGLFDAELVALGLLSPKECRKVVENRESFLEDFVKLFDDEEFIKSFSAGTNTPARIAYRVNSVKNVLCRHAGES